MALLPKDITVPEGLVVQTVQPPRRDAVVDAVRADLHGRSQLGIRKYGTTLEENPDEHVARLQHAYEEALDLANYLKWSIMRLRGEL